MKSNNILEEKWQKLFTYRKALRYIPFINFALVAGSMAIGDVHKNSDFDLIIGVKNGRIFTARLFSMLVFELLGARRKGKDSKENASNKVCLNHFVALRGYTLSPPYNDYWVALYRNLVPFYGKFDEIEAFFKANKWAGKISPQKDKWADYNPSLFSKICEWILKGKLGNFFENFFKKFQIKRIKKKVKGGALGYKPRLKYSDEELEFHIDTKRIEEKLRGKEL